MANTYTSTASLALPIKEGLLQHDVDNLYGAFVSNMAITEKLSGGMMTQTNATNAVLINTRGALITKLYNCSATSIVSITGMTAYVPFILMAGANGSYQLADAAPFYLSAAWTPQANDNLTLVWDGTNYIEIARVDT